MYDELIKRLRTQADAERFFSGEPMMYDKAADAIEELSEERDMYIKAMADEHNRAARLAWEHRWIPVTERLPSQDGYYLVAYKLDVIPQLWHFNVYLFSLDLYKTDKFDFPRKKYKGKSGFYFYDSEYGNIKDNRVTHWMSLPEPPKEK